MPGTEAIPRMTVLGIGISAVDPDRAAGAVMRWVAQGAREIVTVAAVHSVVDAQKQPAAKQAMKQAGLCVPDGVPLVWLCRAAGHSGTRRVFGPDLMLTVSRRLGEAGGSAFYYGGAPGVAEALARGMEARFPGLRTAGVLAPPFRPPTAAEEEAAVEAINRSGADVLWVGLGSPRQEAWMAGMRPRLTVQVLAGVGAAFDYNTGRIRRAPRWMQLCALEWLFRLIQEPRRLWRRYLRNNPLFLWYLLCERAGLRRFD